jgi:hypothetical protein
VAIKNLRINLNDPEVYAQIREMLDWAYWNLKVDRPTEFHSRELSAIFRATKISGWLRANLLVQVGTYAVGEHSYSYLLREQGWDKLSAHLNGPTWEETNALLRPEARIVVVGDLEEVARLDYQPAEFLPRTHLEKGLSLDFEYGEKSHRLWNKLQNINADDKPLYWKGVFPWDYDIVNSAPTTLFQLASRNGGSGSLLAPIRHYLDNRDEYLRFVQASCRVGRKTAKKFFTSVFNGAVLSTSYRQSTLGTLGGNVAGVERLQQSVAIRALISSIRYQNSHVHRVFRDDPWLVYFQHERANLDIMREHLDSVGTRYFLEHDGVRSADPVDHGFLVAEIRRRTGLEYEMKVKHHVFVDDLPVIIDSAPAQVSPFDNRKVPDDEIVSSEDHLR